MAVSIHGGDPFVAVLVRRVGSLLGRLMFLKLLSFGGTT